MTPSEIEVARVKKALDTFMQIRRPPPHIRPKLDLGYRISGQSVEIFEIRPVFTAARLIANGQPHLDSWASLLMASLKLVAK